MCGGTAATDTPARSFGGLSPRVRGNRAPGSGGRPEAGSIPACAEEPGDRGDARAGGRVYPRVCGGTSIVRLRNGRIEGLSPRVRGNPSAEGVEARRSRSIPACAGEPCPPSRRMRSGGVYPRVCGGTSCTIASSAAGSGLSPRVRGNLVYDSLQRCWLRSIPACAGEPPPPG